MTSWNNYTDKNWQNDSLLTVQTQFLHWCPVLPMCLRPLTCVHFGSFWRVLHLYWEMNGSPLLMYLAFLQYEYTEALELFENLRLSLWQSSCCLKPRSTFTFSSGSTEVAWAEGFWSRCLWVQQPRPEMEMKMAVAAAPPLLLHYAHFLSYQLNRCRHQRRRRSDGEEQVHENHCRRSLFWTCHALAGHFHFCLHSEHQQRGLLLGYLAFVEASWLWRKSVPADQTESVWRDTPLLTWFPGHLGQMENFFKNYQVYWIMPPHHIIEFDPKPLN